MRLLVVLHAGSDRGCYRIMLSPSTGGSESSCAMPDLGNVSCSRQDHSIEILLLRRCFSAPTVMSVTELRTSVGDSLDTD